MGAEVADGAAKENDGASFLAGQSIGVITTLTILLHEGKNYVLESIR